MGVSAGGEAKVPGGRHVRALEMGHTQAVMVRRAL